MKKKQNNNILYIVAILIMIIIFIITIIQFKESNKEEKSSIGYTNTNEITQDMLENNEKKMKATMLKESNERTRMQSYFGTFIEYIERKKYEQAYALLYDEFKEKYFPTDSKFKEYCDTKLNFKMFNIEYTNIERNGDIYILWVTLNDPIDGKDSIDLNVVIKENDFNDYVLSFSV